MDFRLQVVLVLISWFFDVLHAYWNFPRARPGALVPSEEDIPLEAFYAPRGNKFHVQLSEINKKPPKYVDLCCGNEFNEWVADDQEVHLEYVLVPTSPRFYGYRKLENIKPVTEYIKDDLQYDFRTKTHSIR